MDKKVIVTRIEQLMLEKGITKYQLRENVDISTTIYQWKKNTTRDKDRTPSLRSIEKICSYLGVSLSYFFAFDQEEQRDVNLRELEKLFKNLNFEQILLLKQIILQFKTDEVKE